MHLGSNRDKNIERDVTGRLKPGTMTLSVNCACYLFPSIIKYVCISFGVVSYILHVTYLKTKMISCAVKCLALNNKTCITISRFYITYNPALAICSV